MIQLYRVSTYASNVVHFAREPLTTIIYTVAVPHTGTGKPMRSVQLKNP